MRRVLDIFESQTLPSLTLVALLLLAAAAGLAGCAGPQADGPDVVIGVIEPFLDNPLNVRGATLAADEINAAPDSPAIEASAFIGAYRRAFGAASANSAALAYDAIMMIRAAIRAQGKADPESVRRGLASIGRYEGVSGTVVFAGTGDPLRSVFIRRVDDRGRMRFHREIKP